MRVRFPPWALRKRRDDSSFKLGATRIELGCATVVPPLVVSRDKSTGAFTVCGDGNVTFEDLLARATTVCTDTLTPHVTDCFDQRIDSPSQGSFSPSGE